MTTYLGEKAVGVGTIKTSVAVADVLHDNTLVGNGNTEPLGVNTENIVSQQTLANTVSVLNTAIDGQANAIAKTREDYIQADSEIHQMINGLSAETTTIKNNQASLGTQVANIEHKIPDGTTGTNSLINKQILAQTSYTKAEVDAKVSSVYKFKGSVSTYDSLPSTATTGDVYNVDDTGANYAWDGSKWDKLSETIDLTAYATTEYVTAREQDIRADLDENISEVHTQVVGLSGEVAKKLNSDGDTMTGPLNVPELNVATPEGTLNLSITAGVATIATNNGLDIVSKTKFDTAPTTDDNTTWADALDVDLVRKAQVVSAISEKQDKLTAGENITIDEDGIISAAGGGSASLPDQTGNSGKFLTTDGTKASWGNALANTYDGRQNSLSLLGVAKTNTSNSIVLGFGASDGYNNLTSNSDNILLGYMSSVRFGSYNVGIGKNSGVSGTKTIKNSISIGHYALTSADNAIQIGSVNGTSTVNSDANTFKVANANGNFEMMSAGGTIPAARHATLPTEDGTYVLKCVMSGGVPTMTWVKE